MTSKNLVLFVLILFLTAACGGGASSNFSGELTPNMAPIVNAGIDATIRLPDNTVSLDGTVTDDGRPANSVVSTAWIVQSGPDGAVFADANAIDTTVTFALEGTYELQLTADDTELQASDSVTVIVEAVPALAIIDVTPATVTLLTGGAQTFSASGTDQYGDAFPVTITWSATGGTINQSGDYVAGNTAGTFDVTATDGAVSGTAGVTIAASPPTADAGGPYTGAEGSVIALDASASTDANDDIASYEWDLDNDGAYDDAVGVSTNFSAVSSGVFTVGVLVTDADGDSDSDTTTITVANVIPTAVAGGPYAGDQGANIALDGSASSDPGNDIVSFAWDLDNDGAYDDASGQMVFFSSTSTGAFTIGLQVTDADGASSTAASSVTVNNVAPTANAGGPYSGDQAATINLDGSASTDPGNNIVSYEWDLDNDGAYDDATGVTTTFSSNDAGVFTVGLRVTDGDGGIDTATATVNVGNVGPTADAGGPYSGDQGVNIALDASASTDPGNNIVSYEWDLDNDGAYDDATGVTTNFNSDDTGVFTVGLRVTDGEGDSGTATATVTVNNVLPTADAGGPYSGDQGTNIALDGSASSDPGNNIVSYEWDLDNDGAYDDATGVNAVFNSATTGVFVVGLRVTDGDTGSGTATATVTVDNVGPTADAGGPYSGDQGANIILDGSGSSDPGGPIALYEWDFDNDGAYNDATGVGPTFTNTVVGVYPIGLRVTDGDGATATATSSVTVDNVLPTADAGGPYSGNQGANIALSGLASNDPGNNITTYEWDLDNDGAYNDATGATPSFAFTETGALTIGLRVTDGDGGSGTATAIVNVANVAPTADASAGAPYSGDEGANITLDASLSSDPGNNITTYEWDFDNDGSYDDATGVTAVFSSGTSGVFPIGLRVTDVEGATGTAATSVTVNDIGLVAYWRFDEGTGTAAADDAGTSNGTLVGAGWGTGVSGSAANFNGTSDYVTIDNTAALDITGTAITLSAWVYPTRANIVGGSRVISKRTDAGGSDVYAMIIDNYRLGFRLDGVDMVGPIVPLNAWTHVTMVYNGIDKRIYVDGVLDATPPQAKTDVIDASVRAVQLGWREGEARYFRGRIDQAQVYDVALSPAEVASVYARDTAPVPSGLFFSDITVAAGASGSSTSGNAVTFAEVDNDSLPDFYTTDLDGINNVRDFFFDNVDGNVFSEEAALRGIDDLDGGSLGAVFADLDNDGDYDLFSGTTWAFNNLGVGDHDNVFENNGAGFFTDVTAGDILATTRETGGVTAFDWDGDGDLDLFAAGGQAGEASEAYRNDGGLVFTSWAGGDLTTVLADESIVTDTDYDGDGDIDLLAADKSGTLVILNNNGSGIFTKVAPGPLGLPGPGTFQVQDGITPADVDNDGDLDILFVSNDIARLYTRGSTGTYVLIRSWTSADGFMGGFADLDNDSFLDFVLAGDEKVYMNNGALGFNPNLQSVPVSDIADPRAIAFADIEGDGDLDFAITANGSRNYLIRNDIDGAGGNWLRIELVSPQCQAGAFGAKTRVYAAGDLGGTQLGLRESRAAHGYFAQDDPVLHFGLGAATSVDVSVTFVDGSTTTRLGVAANQRILIDQCP